MKRYAFPLSLLATAVLIATFAVFAPSQTAPTTPAGPNIPAVVYVSTDPSGSCTMNNVSAPIFLAVNVNTGLISRCKAGTWVNGETTTLQIGDGTDPTKLIKFAASGASTATTLTLADTLSASRTVTITDPGGNANLAYMNPTTAQAISNTTLAQAVTTVPFTVFTTPPVFAGTSSLTSTTDANGTEWWSQIYVPTSFTATGVCAMVGAGTATDKWIGIVWNQAGTVVATSALGGLTFSGSASTYQCQAFTATASLTGPQTYFIGLQGNGTTAGQFYTYAAGFGATGFIGNNATGTFGTVATITPGTTFNGGKPPVMSLY